MKTTTSLPLSALVPAKLATLTDSAPKAQAGMRPYAHLAPRLNPVRGRRRSRLSTSSDRKRSAQRCKLNPCRPDLPLDTDKFTWTSLPVQSHANERSVCILITSLEIDCGREVFILALISSFASPAQRSLRILLCYVQTSSVLRVDLVQSALPLVGNIHLCRCSGTNIGLSL